MEVIKMRRNIEKFVGIFLVVMALLFLFQGAYARGWRCWRWNSKYWCERYGCYWWNNDCHTYPPSCTQPNNQDDCERYGYYWYNGSCHCDPLQCEDITDQTTCQATSGCYWYNNACWGTAPDCEDLNNKADCDNFGCYWWNSACHDQKPSCEAINNVDDCNAYNCYWYDGSCHSGAPPQPGSQAEMPCVVPPFLSETVPPNVLIIMDNSGSMNWPAYVDLNSSNPIVYDYGSYDSDTRYYGYADPDSFYQYGTNRFEITHSWSGTADPAHKRFSGNFLNWLMSRRIDIERQVLVGGKCASRQGTGRKTLIWEDPVQSRYYYKYWWCDDGCRWKFKNHYDQYLYAYRRSSCSSGGYSYKWKVKKQVAGPEEVKGIVQDVYDRVRFGIMHFNSSEGGYVAHWIGGPMSDLVTDIENIGCNTWTPLSETFYEATRYFQAKRGYFTSANYAAHDPIQAWCVSNYVIYLTDGEPTQDRSTPSPYRDWDHTDCDPIPCGANPNDYPWDEGGSDYLNDVALWAHTVDLRDDFQDEQTITLYPVYCFGHSPDAKGVLRRAAKNGAFIDENGNNFPDLQSEWDGDNDGLPDGYYEAENGWQLENALIDIFMNIMQQTSSAAAVSVVSTSDKGEGNVFQAYFSPRRHLAGVDLSWVGELHALWIDPKGNLREDTDQDGKLDLTEDRILHIYFSKSDNATVVERWEDTDGDCEEDVKDDVVTVPEVNSVWRAGDYLWNVNPNDRNIKVIVPAPSGGSLEMIDFKSDPTHRDRVKDYFDFSYTNAGAESLINYIRGVDYPEDANNWRLRTADGKVWKLGDIVNSSPTFVGPPADRYDLVYGDISYRAYYQKYKDRKNVVYVGANDGMLHVFNAGRYIETGNPTMRGYLDDMGMPLGKEIEAIIPYNLVPHLKWLADPQYCHVYYVDLKPKAFDARIFPDDDKHPNGWGTVLVCGMRFGGTEYNIPDIDNFKSAYFALDITDPEDIEFMWEINWDDLAFTTSYPGVVKCGDKWFVLAGSGPTSVGGSSSQYSKLYIIDVSDTSYYRALTGSDDGHFADPTPVDVDLDGNVDVIYIGESYWFGSSWRGKIYKIITHESDNLDDWDIYTFLDVPGPVTAGGAITMDDQGRVWVYFGSGRYYSDIDETDYSTQYFFGVVDTNWDGYSYIDFDDLTDITDLSVQQTDSGTYVYNYGTEPVSYDSLLLDLLSGVGWKMTLENGERVINRPILLGGVIFFATYIPNEELCSFGGSSRLYGLDYRTGVPGETSILGMDEDGWLLEFVEIGEGVPSAPAAHVGITDEAMIAVQLSTGAIAQETASIHSPKSKAIFWRGK